MAIDSNETSNVAFHNPLDLATTYKAGLRGGLWKTHSEAALVLTEPSAPISRAFMQRAIAVSKLPNDILSLFDDNRPLTYASALKLLKVVSRDGVHEVALRARQMSGTKPPSVKHILHGLAGDKPLPTRSGRKPGVLRTEAEMPLALAKTYAEGVASGRWSSKTAASTALNLNKAEVPTAVRIANLPSEVLSLFDPSALSLNDGRKLLTIEKAVGRISLIARASAITLPLPPKKQIFDFLKASEQVSHPRAEDEGIWDPQPLIDAYERGKADGRWSTKKDASLILGMPRGDLSLASRFSRLPPTVRSLFDRRTLTRPMARKVITAARRVGVTALLASADAIRATENHLSNDELLMVLNGAAVPKGGALVTVDFHQSYKVAFLRINSKFVHQLAKHTIAIQEYCELLLKQFDSVEPLLQTPRRSQKRRR